MLAGVGLLARGEMMPSAVAHSVPDTTSAG
jgi:hypothetical protein